jgi:hypothetical protein
VERAIPGLASDRTMGSLQFDRCQRASSPRRRIGSPRLSGEVERIPPRRLLRVSKPAYISSFGKRVTYDTAHLRYKSPTSGIRALALHVCMIAIKNTISLPSVSRLE